MIRNMCDFVTLQGTASKMLIRGEPVRKPLKPPCYFLHQSQFVVRSVCK